MDPVNTSLEPRISVEGAAPRHCGKRAAWIGALAFAYVGVALAVQRPYFATAYALDDFDHLAGIHRVQFGGEPLASFLLTPHNEHLIPLWRLWYFVAWRCFGLDPTAWHLLITIGHGVSALFVYLIVERHAGWRGGLAAGILWAGATIGAMDNPVIWIAASHLALSVDFHLASLAANRLTAGPRWLLGTIVMGLTLTAGLLTMGATLPIAMLLPLERYWLDGAWRRPKRENIVWLLAWGAPVLASIIAQVFWVTPRINYLVEAVGPPDWIKAIHLEVSGFVLALEQLLPWPILSVDATLPTMIGWAAALTLTFALAREDGDARRFLVASFLVLAGYAFLACAARSRWQAETVIGWGRYRYAPTLWWVMAIGVGAGGLSRGLGQRGRRLLATAAIILLPGYLIRQAILAQSATERFAQTWGRSTDDFFKFLAATEELDQLAAKSGVQVTLPDGPLFGGLNFYRSQAIDLGISPALTNVRFAPPEAVDSDDRDRAQALIANVTRPGREILRQSLAPPDIPESQPPRR